MFKGQNVFRTLNNTVHSGAGICQTGSTRSTNRALNQNMLNSTRSLFALALETSMWMNMTTVTDLTTLLENTTAQTTGILITVGIRAVAVTPAMAAWPAPTLTISSVQDPACTQTWSVMGMSSVAGERTRLGRDARLLTRQEALTGRGTFGTL